MGGAASAADSTDEEMIEEVVVTGSRIQRTELSQPAPVIKLDAEEIARFGTPDLASVLAELPAVGATDTLTGNIGNNELAGISSADLRRLGASRTLVLVNGKRHVAAVAGSSQVDLSTIPLALVERVEIVTGGASAIYGSDAVSGVVNVILRDKFDGIEVNVNGADSTENVDNRNFSSSITAGTQFAEDKGNFAVFAGLDRISQTLAGDIRQFSNFGTIANPLDTGEDDGIPDRLFVPNVLSERINDTGVINPFGSGIGIRTFDRNGDPITQQTRDESNSFAFGSFPNGCDTCFGTETADNYLPEIDRVSHQLQL